MRIRAFSGFTERGSVARIQRSRTSEMSVVLKRSAVRCRDSRSIMESISASRVGSCAAIMRTTESIGVESNVVDRAHHFTSAIQSSMIAVRAVFRGSGSSANGEVSIRLTRRVTSSNATRQRPTSATLATRSEVTRTRCKRFWASVSRWRPRCRASMSIMSVLKEATCSGGDEADGRGGRDHESSPGSPDHDSVIDR